MVNDTQPRQRSLAAVVGAAAAAALLLFAPRFEGTVLHTYKDIGGVLTYCTGATENAQYGKNYTLAECKAQLDRDLVRHAEGVLQCVHVKLTDGQKTAFVDAAYNIGIKAFCQSSMTRLANTGNMQGACAALSQWNKVNGRPVKGLTARREQERKLCEE